MLFIMNSIVRRQGRLYIWMDHSIFDRVSACQLFYLQCPCAKLIRFRIMPYSDVVVSGQIS